MSSIFKLQVKAYNLPNYRLIHTPNCYAHITIDGGYVGTTQAVSGSNPEWSECFDISLNELSTIKLQLFHVQSPTRTLLRGTALIPVGNLLPQDHEIIIQHKLRESGLQVCRMGSVGIILRRRFAEQPQDTSVDTFGSNVLNSKPIQAVGATSNPPNAVEKVADGLLEDVGLAEKTVMNLKGYDGTIFGNTAMVTSSDLYKNILGLVGKVVQFGDVISQVNPYAQLAWNVLTVLHKALTGQLIRDDKIKSLLLTIHDMLEFVEEADAISKISKLQLTVASMMEKIHECAQFIQKYGAKGLAMRAIRDNLSSTTDDRIEQFIAAFRRLKENFNQGINVQTFRLLEATEADKLLERLPGWNLDGVKFNESKACLSGTRQRLLEQICTWVYSTDDKCILWLSGGAGTGKTSIAHSIAVHFDNLGHLGACFYFNRDTAGLNSPNNLFGNLCYQLAHYDKHHKAGVKSMILAEIDSMGYVASSSLRTQAKKLIVNAINGSQLIGPILVVIDALDEAGIEETRRELLTAIAAELPKLSCSVKIMITSRNEPDIRACLHDSSKELCIDDATDTVDDITSYIQHRLTVVRQRSHLPQGWPGCKKVQELARRAGHLFIWASVACNFIEEKRDPAWRLDLLLDVTSGVNTTMGSPLKHLDALYGSIFRNAFPDEDDLLVDFRYVMGSIVMLEVPLTPMGLDSLLGLGNQSGEPGPGLRNHGIHLSSSEEILLRLRSILKADSKANGEIYGPIRLLHPSVYDFLTSRAEGNFRIDSLAQNRTLAILCFGIMNSELRFDICHIGDPSLLNQEIENLPDKIRNQISEGLSYSCRSAIYHLTKVSEPDATLNDVLKRFVSENLLHWIEAMSLLGEINKAEGSLHALAEWLKVHANEEPEPDLKALVGDAISLLRNCGQAVRLSALHTYYSALPLSPKTTTLFRCFAHKVPHVPNILSSHPTWPTAHVRVMEYHTDTVNHAAFSPDGKILASASHDKTVRLWDVESGQSVGDALTGHTDSIRQVIFSPDGKKLASVSFDWTVRIWNIESGKRHGEVLEGHTHLVRHAVFSPDGKRLATASYDKTVRLWNLDGQRAIGETLEGHTDWVHYVMFSPDGKMLASASQDRTVQLWNVETCKTIGAALEGHTKSVCCVVFSPDGKKVATASDDMTIRLWDVERGRQIGMTLEGHTDKVLNVTFSPDGKKLASASFDKMVRLWDVGNCCPIGGALEGHNSWVRCALFSPDGRKLVSASYDKTVRLWDVESGRPIGNALEGHTDWVRYATFSPDGQKLASASDDKTVRLWDIGRDCATGETLRGHTERISHLALAPHGKLLATASYDYTVRVWDVSSGCTTGGALEGHTGWVRYVAFSPDGEMLASASDDKTLRLWDVHTGKCIGGALEGHSSWINHVAFSPDGRCLASASSDTTVRIWDTQSGHAIGDACEGHGGWVNYVAFSPDGKKLASASTDKTVRIWDLERAQVIETILEGHTDGVYEVVFSPDGKKLATVSSDKTVRLWDVENGKATGHALVGHTEGVQHVVFSPSGNMLESISESKTVRRWDTRTGQCIYEASESCSDNLYSCRAEPQAPGPDEQWITDFRADSTHHDSQHGKFDSVDKVRQVAMSFDELGFLRHGGRRLVWLPSTFRGAVAVRSSLVVAGGDSGAVTIITFPRTL